jgi:hypothetical protein
MNIQNHSPSLGVLTVATNVYIDYWREMAFSFNANIKLNEKVVLHVFTNQIDQVEKFKAELKNVRVVGHEIANYKWPEATLLRYRIFEEFARELPEEFLMHLDADMVINQPPLEIILKALTKSPICLVSHPGYWRPKKLIDRSHLYRKNARFFLNDLRMMFKSGGLGSWETDKNSVAYVARRYRRNYVCGGIWFGEKNSFLKLVSELSHNVEVDSERNRIAVWHDESHLNYWASKNLYHLLDPELCFDSTYPQLEGLIPTITAVDKKIATR